MFCLTSTFLAYRDLFGVEYDGKFVPRRSNVVSFSLEGPNPLLGPPNLLFNKYRWLCLSAAAGGATRVGQVLREVPYKLRYLGPPGL